MSDPVQIALIVMIGGMVSSIAPIVTGFITRNQLIKNHNEIKQNIEVVRTDVNGKMEKMQQVIASASKAEGKLEGHAEAVAEAKVETAKKEQLNG